jgi:endoglucanase
MSIFTACETTKEDETPPTPEGEATSATEKSEKPKDPDNCGQFCIGGDHRECRPPARDEVDFPGYDPSEQDVRDISSIELIKEIKTGWNLGNTFDAPGCETAWGNPVTSYTMIYTVAEAGFDSVRLPVTWAPHLGEAPDYRIDEDWLNRVEQIVKYILAADMYCILNTHHEYWLFPDEENYEENRVQLVAVWTQLSERFADYNEKLIFEGMNEPRLFGTPNEWNGGTYDAQQIVNRLNSAFVETVRSSGGNNSIRHLMIPSYAASAEIVAMQSLFEAFEDFHDDDKIIASIHAYTPHAFALQVDGMPFWRDSHKEEIDRLFANIKRIFLDEGVPVILGETGAMIKDGNLEDRLEWTKYYFGKSRELGVPAYWWDNGLFVQNEHGTSELFGILYREQGVFAFPEIVDEIMG